MCVTTHERIVNQACNPTIKRKINQNPESRWSPADPTEISPEDYEGEVLGWLSKTPGIPWIFFV